MHVGDKFIGSIFIVIKINIKLEDFIFQQFVKIWASICVCLKLVNGLKNALHYTLLYI